ncbi:MAG: T9SS type A sorting domain-containing protein [Chitinophagaceae bacterium]
MKLRPLETVNGLLKSIGKISTPLCRCTIIALAITLPAILSGTKVYSQCTPPSMKFRSPTLVGGRDGRVGATYKFANVATGIDCYITIQALSGGAALGEIDNTTQGYNDAWQPYVTAGARSTSYLDWKINFKKAGTTTDTLLPCLAITAIDVDGDGSQLKEFIVASTPGAYAVDPYTTLSVTFDGTNSTAIGSYVTVPNIDTNARQAMFQMNFTNVSTIIYRNGSMSTKSTTDERHTCIYFKSFFEFGLIALPVNLLSFNAKKQAEAVQLTWKVADEQNMLHYTVQRSYDGENWTSLGKVNAMNIAGTTHTYVFYDRGAGAGTVHYRLQHTNNQEQASLSSVVTINNNTGGLSVNCPTLISGSNITLQLQAPANDEYTFSLYSLQGQLIKRLPYQAQKGNNQVQMNIPATRPTGVYLLTAQNRQGVVVHKNTLLLQ